MEINGKEQYENFQQGVLILSKVLSNYGFSFILGEIGKGSGGTFFEGSFLKEDETDTCRALYFGFRYRLGWCSYRIGQAGLSHQDYMRCLDVHKKAKYPGFSTEPLDGFYALADDIENYCSDFLYGNGEQFTVFSKAPKLPPWNFPSQKGFKGLQ